MEKKLVRVTNEPPSGFVVNVIYQSKSGDFLNQGERVTLMNKHNYMTNNSLTIAQYKVNTSETVVKDSSNITQLIGQSNYDLLFSVLCSCSEIYLELKVRAILALLTVPNKNRDAETQTNNSCNCKISSADNMTINYEHKLTQTEETFIDLFPKGPVIRKRRKFNAYTVRDSPEPENIRKLVIKPENFKEFSKMSSKSDSDFDIKGTDIKPISNDNELPVLQLDEDSRESIGQCSVRSINTCSDILYNPMGMLQNIDKVTEQNLNSASYINKFNNEVDSNSSTITLLDKTKVTIPWKIKDHFHIATPEQIKHIPQRLQNSFVLYQLYIDWKYCLVPDEDQHLPIHIAALNGDIDLIKRQCAVLKINGHSVDIPTGDNLSALQISIYGDNAAVTSALLAAGADPLILDDGFKNCFHLAAEAAPDHLKALINHCKDDPLSLLKDNEDLWKQEFESKPKEFLSSYLLEQMSISYDVQGYSPLMLAVHLGRYENVKTILEAVQSVNTTMPNSGNTPLHIAVSAAHQDCINRGNKSIVTTDFMRTIEVLIENGAELTIPNHSGLDVGSLLSELDMRELSMLVIDKINSRVTGIPSPSGTSSVKSLMLLKDANGHLTYCNINSKNRVNFREDANAMLCDADARLSDLRSYRKNDGKRLVRNKEVLNILPVPNDPLAINSTLKVDIKNEDNSVNTNNDKTFMFTSQRLFYTCTNNDMNDSEVNPLISVSERETQLKTETNLTETVLKSNVSVIKQNELIRNETKQSLPVNVVTKPLILLTRSALKSVPSKTIGSLAKSPIPVAIVRNMNVPEPSFLSSKLPMDVVSRQKASETIVLSKTSDTEHKGPSILGQWQWNASELLSPCQNSISKPNEPVTIKAKHNASDICLKTKPIILKQKRVMTNLSDISFATQINNKQQKTVVVTIQNPLQKKDLPVRKTIRSKSKLPLTLVNRETKTGSKIVCLTTGLATTIANTVTEVNTSDSNEVPLISTKPPSELFTSSSNPDHETSSLQLPRKRNNAKTEGPKAKRVRPTHPSGRRTTRTGSRASASVL